MSKKHRKSHVDLSSLDGNERNKVYERARKLRKAQKGSEKNSGRKPSKKVDVHDWQSEESDPAWARMKSPTAGSLEDYVEQVLEEESVASLSSSAGPVIPGRVVHVDAGRLEVLVEDGERRAVDIPSDLQGDSVTVGDHVEFLMRPGDPEPLRGELTRVLPRRTRLARLTKDGTHEQVAAANIDRVVLVTALHDPPLRPRLIDRYLIAIEHGGAKPIICINKMDLKKDGDDLSALEPYRTLGIPMAKVSATEGAGLDELRRLIAGQTVALVGQSGVGKSSILNALAGLSVATGQVTEHRGKGRHTTTASTLHVLPDGTEIIDTPGVRSFALSGVDAEHMAAYFPEFADHPCRFRNCRHLKEPGCGVKAAVESGQVGRYRYETYVKLVE